MHVGFFIDSYYPVIDGVTNIVDAYASRLVDKCDVTIFCPKVYGTDQQYYERFPYKVVRCKSIMKQGDDYPQGFPIFDSEFKKTIRDAHLDLIHVHSAFPVGLCAKASSRKYDIPMVGTIHSDFRPDVIQYLGKPLGEATVKLMMTVYNSCDECWTVNDVVGRMFCNDYGLRRPYRAMPYATDHHPVADSAAARRQVNAAFGLKDDDFVLAHVGRQDLQKREDFVLRSLAVLKKKGAEFKVLFVGSGNKQDYLKELTRTLGLEDNIIFCGRISDQSMMMNIFSRLDLLLFPSESDTYGLVKIEAACQKTPTLLCEGTRASDGIVDGVNGFISVNNEEAYSDYILKLSKDPALLEKVGEGASKSLYNTWDNLVDDVYEKYLYIIENHKFVK